MKKILSMVLVLMMAVSKAAAAYGEECKFGEKCTCAEKEPVYYIGPIKAKIEVNLNVYTGETWWCISENRLVTGKIRVDEKVDTAKIAEQKTPYVRGFVDNGLIREKGAIRYTEIGGTILGLTELEATVTIWEQYTEAVETVVHEKLGENVEISANSILSCSLRWETNTVYHMFADQYSGRIPIGTVTLNGGESTTLIYICDFDGNGTFEIVFSAGWIPYEEPKQPENDPESRLPEELETEPECKPEPTVIVQKETVYVEKTTVCKPITQIINQVNINSTVTNTQTVNINNGIICKKTLPCAEKCMDK